jgi:CheY-like chemotaxis protein
MDRAPRRILVVDDDRSVLRFLRDFLEHAGYVVDTAPDGETAFQRISSAAPDLVTLDLVMPGLDGWGVLARLETLANVPPVLLLSGQLDEAEGRRLPPAVAGLVHKSEDPRILLEACTRILENPIRDDSSRPGAERRRAPRRPLVVPVRISSPYGPTLGEGQLVRLSPIGADLETVASLEGWTVVRVWIPFPSCKDPVPVDGQLHPRGLAADTYAYGVSFVDLSPAVQELLEHLLA